MGVSGVQGLDSSWPWQRLQAPPPLPRLATSHHAIILLTPARATTGERYESHTARMKLVSLNLYVILRLFFFTCCASVCRWSYLADAVKWKVKNREENYNWGVKCLIDLNCLNMCSQLLTGTCAGMRYHNTGWFFLDCISVVWNLAWHVYFIPRYFSRSIHTSIHHNSDSSSTLWYIHTHRHLCI